MLLSDHPPHRASKPSRERCAKAPLKLSRRSPSCSTSVSLICFPFHLVGYYISPDLLDAPTDCRFSPPFLFPLLSFFGADERCRTLTTSPIQIYIPFRVYVCLTIKPRPRLIFPAPCCHLKFETRSNVIRAPRLVWDGAQERPLDPGGPVEWGRLKDDLLEDAHQLTHGFRTPFSAVAHPLIGVVMTWMDRWCGFGDEGLLSSQSFRGMKVSIDVDRAHRRNNRA